jgi:hypothetical protein
MIVAEFGRRWGEARADVDVRGTAGQETRATFETALPEWCFSASGAALADLRAERGCCASGA